MQVLEAQPVTGARAVTQQVEGDVCLALTHGHFVVPALCKNIVSERVRDHCARICSPKAQIKQGMLLAVVWNGFLPLASLRLLHNLQSAHPRSTI